MKSDYSIWQLAGGPASRSYSDLFLKYGVGLIGPGDAGPWNSNRIDEDFGGGFVRRFANEMQIDDVVLLRTGISTISAIGIVASKYLYLNQFDDVNGWDLQHARRIRWTRLPEPFTFNDYLFGGNPSRFSKIWNDEVYDYIKKFLNSPPNSWQIAPLPELPQEESELEEIPNNIQNVISLIRDLTPLFSDRERFGDLPTEDELVAHFVIPFLKALGWSPEHIAIKWRYVDVAVFKSLPRVPENCAFIIEAKRFGTGMESALEQA